MNALTPIRPEAPAPVGLLAELTHRCPLRCPYCSNPLELDRRSGELDTATWQRVLREAAGLGVLHVHLSGGEPTTRSDIVAITQTCAELGLYSNLITSGVGGALAKLQALYDVGLDHVQLSVQGVDAQNAERIGGLKNAQPQKLEFAARVVALGLPLTLNAVIHRGNIHEVEGFIDLAATLGAKRLEVAHTQYYGWAYVNRAALMPDKAQVDASIRIVEAARERLNGELVIDLVVPDYYAKYPKACAGGWGRKLMNVTPRGKVLPCHAAETIPGLEFWHVTEHALGEIWRDSPAFGGLSRHRLDAGALPSCDRREKDWGGCRCQALALAGEACGHRPGLLALAAPRHGAGARGRGSGDDPAGLRLPDDRQQRPIAVRGGHPRVKSLATTAVVLALAAVPAHGGEAPRTTAVTPASVAAVPAASDLLFDQPQMKNAAPGSTITYGYLRRSGIEKGPFGAPLQDTITLKVEPGKNPDARDIGVVMFSGLNRVPAGPFEDMTGNPVVSLFLENHLKALSRVLEANPRYLKLAIRKGLRDGATVTPAKVTVEGRQTVDAWRVVRCSPSSDDKMKATACAASRRPEIHLRDVVCRARRAASPSKRQSKSQGWRRACSRRTSTYDPNAG